MNEAHKPCPICGTATPHAFLRQPNVPVHQNLLFADAAAARAITRGELDMRVCADCGFVFNAAFDPALLAYGAGYDNTQECSPAFEAHLDERVRHLRGARGVQGHRIVEVGCGKGTFLRKLVADPSGRNTGYGFDPSYTGPDSDLDGRARFERRAYGPECAHILADTVVCRHVIEHVPAPCALLSAVRAALPATPKSRVFFETPCVEWILRNRVVWDLFYEHCSLFSAASLTNAFNRSGFRVESVSHVFSGQYLWLEAVPVDGAGAPRADSAGLPALAAGYATALPGQLDAWRATIHGHAGQGRIAVWGAGAKGCTFVNLVDPECTAIDCVIDLNPAKQGHFVAGTGHPIVDYHALPARGVQQIVLMNPNYRGENAALLAAAGIHARFLEPA
ncbi:MAG: class I SAM-dependent methyltransferase [Burkholderiales bacterium]